MIDSMLILQVEKHLMINGKPSGRMGHKAIGPYPKITGRQPVTKQIETKAVFRKLLTYSLCRRAENRFFDFEGK